MADDAFIARCLVAIDSVIDGYEARCATDFERHLVSVIREMEAERRRKPLWERVLPLAFWLHIAGGVFWAAGGAWWLVREVLR